MCVCTEGRREKRRIEEEEESGCHLSTKQEEHREYPEMISINILIWASQVALDFAGGSDSKASAYQMKTQVQSLGREDLLEKEMATHSSILAWKIPWMEEPGRQVHGGCKESDMTE